MDSPHRFGRAAGYRRLSGVLVMALVIVASCSSGEAGSGAPRETAGSGQPSTEATTGTSGRAPVGEAPASVAPASGLLASGRAVSPDPEGPSAELVTLQEEPYIGAAVYPRPDYEGNPWSQWGQGIALDDGRVLMGIGDHLGVDGNSYLFVYDPGARTVTRFASVLDALPHEPGEFGYGKIHSQMVDPGDGGVWFTTYYGTRRGLAYGGNYLGDVLFRIDKQTLELRPVSIPVPGHGIASLATDGAGHLFAEPVDPMVSDDIYPVGGTTVIDVTTGEAVSFPDDPGRDVFRDVMVGADGTAWFAGDDGGLFRYDPETAALDFSEGVLSASLRASTRPAADGTIYGVTEEPYSFFAFAPDGTVPRRPGQAPELCHITGSSAR